MSKTKSIAPPPKTPLSATTVELLEELNAWHARHPALTELDHRTFYQKYPDAYRERLASRSKARSTLKNAVSWLRQLHAPFASAAHGETGLSSVTVAHLVELTRNLALALEAADTGAADDHAVQREAAREALNTRYGDTRARIDEAIGQNETWRAQLVGALHAQRHTEFDADAARVLRLADALRAWFDAKGDDGEVIRASLAHEGVTRDTIKRCEEAASALERARGKAAAVLPGNDTPPVNRAEGAVLALMQEVLRKVNRARENKTTTLVLRVDPATRNALTPNAGRKTSAKDPPPPTQGPGATETAPATRPRKAKRHRVK